MTHDNHITSGAIHEIDSCWNRIGVHGTGACPELAQYVHCRNCPVFSLAARSRLEVVPPKDYLENLTRHYAELRKESKARDRSLLVFRLGAEWLGLSSSTVVEIIRDQVVHRIPHSRSPNLRGLINHRGELVLCVDLKAVLNLQFENAAEEPRMKRSRMVLLSAPQGPVAVHVSEVAGIERYRNEQGLAPPGTLSCAPVACVDCLFPWGGKHISCLNEGRMFNVIARSLS